MCFVSIRDINFRTNGIKREQRLSKSVELLFVCLFVCFSLYLLSCLVDSFVRVFSLLVGCCFVCLFAYFSGFPSHFNAID